MTEKSITVGVFQTAPDAHLAKMKLAGNGVESVIFGENLVMAQPYTGWGAIELKVARGDAERATEILQSAQQEE